MKETTGPPVFLQETIFCPSVRDISRGVCAFRQVLLGDVPLVQGLPAETQCMLLPWSSSQRWTPINQTHVTVMQRPECNFLYVEEHSSSTKRFMSGAQGIHFLVSAYMGCQSAIRKLAADAEIPAKGVLGLHVRGWPEEPFPLPEMRPPS